MSRIPSRRKLATTLALGASFAGLGVGAAAAAPLPVVASDLANPRGMTFGPGGKLYVAEAGSGGTGACLPDPEGGAPNCLGASGAITAIDVTTGVKTTLVGGLPSLATQTVGDDGSQPGDGAIGPQDVSFRGKTGYFTIGLGGNTATRATLGPTAASMATLQKRTANGKVRTVADLAAYETANNPDVGTPGSEDDTNPYGVDATDGDVMMVADSGGNDLLRVRDSGRVTTVAVFPGLVADAPPFLGLPPGTKIPVQAVPTGVVRIGQTFQVGTLTGFPFPPGGANVFAVRSSGSLKVTGSGFTNVIDVARGPGGSVYALELATDGLLSGSGGRLVKITRDGAKIVIAGPDQLVQPTGLAVASDGSIYVAVNGTSGSAGAIVKIAAP